jgi:hypothetical protein
MEWSYETCTLVKEVFHLWDSGTIEDDSLFVRLMAQGLNPSAEFRSLIQQHHSARNLPYATFIKSLKACSRIEDIGRPAQSNRRSCKLSHAITFKDIPVPSSAKAPFGTDNNMYIRGVRMPMEESPETCSLISSGLSIQRKSFGNVAGANDAFKESNIDDTSSVCSQSPSELPRHLRVSMNPITGDIYDDSSNTFDSRCSREVVQPKDRKENILEWTNMGNEQMLLSVPSKRYFQNRPEVGPNPLEWNPTNTAPGPDPTANHITMRNILSHDPDSFQIPYRPLSRIVFKPKTCPFATDADDLASMGVPMLSQSLASS